MVYLIHFSQPFHHARHYIGFCEENGLEKRFLRHKSGDGSRLLRALVQNDIEFSIVRVWPGASRTFERQLKNRKKSGHFCPVCNPKIKGVMA